MNLFPIYRALKPYKEQGYKVIYINLVWIWVILSIGVSAYFSYFHINGKINEFQWMEKNYAHYQNHLIKFKTPPALDAILKKIIISHDTIYNFPIAGYYRVKLDSNSYTLPFSKLILNKAAASNSLFLQVQTQNLQGAVVIYNSDWLIYHDLDLRQLLKEQIGNYWLYFKAQSQFNDHKIYASLTWEPSCFRIYLLNGFTLIIYCITVLCGCGLIILFFTKSLTQHQRFVVESLTEHSEKIKKYLIGNKRVIFWKCIERIYYK